MNNVATKALATSFYVFVLFPSCTYPSELHWCRTYGRTLLQISYLDWSISMLLSFSILLTAFVISTILIFVLIYHVTFPMAYFVTFLVKWIYKVSQSWQTIFINMQINEIYVKTKQHVLWSTCCNQIWYWAFSKMVSRTTYANPCYAVWTQKLHLNCNYRIWI